MTEREKQIEELRKETGCTRAHAVAMLNAQEAAKNRVDSELAARARLSAEQAAGQTPSTMEGAQ